MTNNVSADVVEREDQIGGGGGVCIGTVFRAAFVFESPQTSCTSMKMRL